MAYAPMNTPEFVAEILAQSDREVLVQVADSGRDANGNTTIKLYVYANSAGGMFGITQRLAKLLGYRIVNRPHGALSFPGDLYEFTALLRRKFPLLRINTEDGGSEF